MLYLGMVAGLTVGNAAAHASGIDALRAYVAMLVLIPLVLIGSRLLFVVIHWRVYQRDLRRIWDRNDGGAAMYGGLFLGLAFSVWLLATLDLPFGGFWDVMMFSILVGMIFTRVGCLLNGCCGGRPSRSCVAIYLPNSAGVWERRLPTQVFELVWAGVLLIGAATIWERLPFRGALFLLVVASYAAGRLLLEGFREPEPGAKRFNVYHVLSLAMIVSSLAALAAGWTLSQE
jgi:phosphatidylglycerol:prolipoprotein diacylglycerol transferase